MVWESTSTASLLVCMVLLSVTLNFIQEHRAGKAAEKLQEKVALKVTVLREGKEIEIMSSKLVPGDILMLKRRRFDSSRRQSD
jgi:P-type Mg2+ transporter